MVAVVFWRIEAIVGNVDFAWRDTVFFNDNIFGRLANGNDFVGPNQAFVFNLMD